MRFLLDDEQRAFARSLDGILGAADVPAAARAWAAGDFAPGRALWGRLAAAGVFALPVPDAYEGLAASPLDLAVAYVELGRHAVPSPVVETAASAVLLAALAGTVPAAKEWLARIATGSAVATLHIPAVCGPYALDADAADAVFAVAGDELRLLPPPRTPPVPSTDPARRLFCPAPGGDLLACGPQVRRAAARAADHAALATAAQALGLGLSLLDRTVAHARQRTQFGVPIGSFQAVKHRLADTHLALEFARPLLHGAAVTLAPTDIAAAKLTCTQAAYTAARTALQLHGAIGYTEELPLSHHLRKARPLRHAWGTPSACRARVLKAAPRP